MLNDAADAIASIPVVPACFVEMRLPVRRSRSWTLREFGTEEVEEMSR